MQQSMPPSTTRQCITNSDLVSQNTYNNYECKTIDHKTNGNTISYTLECKGAEGVMQISGTITYTDNSMNGKSTTNFKMEGQSDIQMTSKIKGKYVGSCSK